MNVLLERIAHKDTYTIGRLYINGVYQCDTLEDTDRGLCENMSEAEIATRKIRGQTAIPTGEYRIDMRTVSPRFKRILPRLIAVKGFQGVLIHAGNTAADTEGCILVGENRKVGALINSRASLEKLHGMLTKAQSDGEEIKLLITRKYQRQ